MYLLMFYKISLYSTQNHFRLFLSKFMKGGHDHLTDLLLLIIGCVNEGQTEFYEMKNNTKGVMAVYSSNKRNSFH